jgi:hypothetical protein
MLVMGGLLAVHPWMVDCRPSDLLHRPLFNKEQLTTSRGHIRDVGQYLAATESITQKKWQKLALKDNLRLCF